MSQKQQAELRRQVAFVTGGTGTLGHAVCRHLARAGADVSFLFKDNQDKATRMIEELAEAGFPVTGFQGDVRDRTRLAAIFQSIAERVGPVDTLIHTALSHQEQPFDGFSDREFDLAMAMNLKGVTICTQEAWPHLKQHSCSAVIFAIPKPNENAPLDLVSAHGRLALMHGIASFGRDIGCRAHAVWIEFPNLASDVTAHLDRMAEAIVALASPSCRKLNDQTLVIR